MDSKIKKLGKNKKINFNELSRKKSTNKLESNEKYNPNRKDNKENNKDYNPNKDNNTCKEDNKILTELLEKLKIAEKKYGFERTQDVTEFKKVEWKSLNLENEILKGIEYMKYDYPSPVQFKTIKGFSDRNLIVRAKNGTGKTAAYLIPIINEILIENNKENENESEERNLRTIILVPTRELALQVSKVGKKLLKFTKIEIMATFGGSNLYEDILRIKNGVDIVVTTPGRILDMIEKKITNFNFCKNLIIDEADKLLSPEFQFGLNKIIGNLQLKKIMLFSATFPSSVDNFVKNYMKFPLYINMMKELTLLGITQFYALVNQKYKLICLKTILKKINFKKCVIFCNSIKNVELLARKISDMGFSHYFIHSKMSQEERNKVFHNFSEKNAKILVSSDLVTRGIDVPSVNCVINFDFPRNAESYIHRIGRSGRFGSQGISISLICDYEKDNLIEIEKKLGVELLPVSDEKFKKYQK